MSVGSVIALIKALSGGGGGGGGGALMVNVEIGDSGLVLDKTWTEISTAASAGPVIAVYAADEQIILLYLAGTNHISLGNTYSAAFLMLEGSSVTGMTFTTTSAEGYPVNTGG